MRVFDISYYSRFRRRWFLFFCIALLTQIIRPAEVIDIGITRLKNSNTEPVIFPVVGRRVESISKSLKNLSKIVRKFAKIHCRNLVLTQVLVLMYYSCILCNLFRCFNNSFSFSSIVILPLRGEGTKTTYSPHVFYCDDLFCSSMLYVE